MDFIAIGDATLDVFVGLKDAEVRCDDKNENCKLCVDYPDKIAASSLDFVIAGNALNAAVGARRLGVSSAFFGTVGDDDTGRKIIATLHKEGVSSEYVTVDKTAESNYSVVLTFEGDRTILVYHVPRHYTWNVDDAPKWFYVTSMGEGFEAIYDKTWQMIEATGAKAAFNPGTHQLKKGLSYLKPFIAKTDILFLNREEATALIGIHDQSPAQDILKGLHKIGCRVAVVTDGAKGSYAYDGTTMYHLGIFDGPLVDRTGSGDAFGTGFTVAQLKGLSIPDSMRWGTANSRSVVTKIGAEAGLLTGDKMEHDLKQFTTKPTEL